MMMDVNIVKLDYVKLEGKESIRAFLYGWEWGFITTFIEDADFRFKDSRRQLKCLWTSFCIHNDIEVDTAPYDTFVQDLWNMIEKHCTDTAAWKDFDDFDGYLCELLV